MGVFAKILKNSWPSFVAVTYPPLLLLGGFALAILVGLMVAITIRPLAGDWAYLATAAALMLPFSVYGIAEKKLNAFWLARSCTFLVDRSRGRMPGIEERCIAFAERIAEAANSDANDEVLLVGHSVGTHLAVTVAARASERLAPDRRFSLLTLGQAIAMTPNEPQAHQFRNDLLAISASSQIDWIDVTSAVDGSCIPLTDPLQASDIERPAGARVQPKLVSAQFHKAFTGQTYESIRRDFLRTHFQYLMAAELRSDYDYFLITAGDKTLAQRFAHLDSVTGFNRFRLGQS
jgi:hypothetical protein